MTDRQANAILAALEAAYPSKRIKPDTLMLWKSKLAPLDYERSRKAVDDLIEGVTFWPSIAEFKEAYRRHRPYSVEPETDEPEPTPEEREWMLEQLHAYTEQIGQPVEHEHDRERREAERQR